MEGKTHGKDIMLLCKGWYDKEKYKTTKDALIEYYHKHYGNEDITPDYGFINFVLLKPAIDELLTERFRGLFIHCLFDTDIFTPWKYDRMNIKEFSYEEELYYRLNNFIHSLRSLEDDDTVLIDTSDYWLKENGLEVIVDDHRVLSEDII